MARYRVLSWGEIPAQVKAIEDDGAGRPVSLPLDAWFAQEIDRVAMREGLAASDAYLERWAWSDYHERPGPAAEVAADVVRELEAAWAAARQGHGRNRVTMEGDVTG